MNKHLRSLLLALFTLSVLFAPTLATGDFLLFAQEDLACTQMISRDASIQAAIDAAESGDVLCIGSGIWTENVAIDKTLTLKGLANTIIDGALNAQPTLTLINSASDGTIEVVIENLDVRRNWPSCIEQAPNCSSGILIGERVSASLNKISVGQAGTYGIELEGDASLALGFSGIFGNAIHGILMRDESSAFVQNSSFQLNGKSPECQSLSTLCNGIELRDQASVVISDSIFIDNADWGLAAAVERCGYDSNEFLGRAAFDGINDFLRNDWTGNQADLGNPGFHALSDLPAGQLCTQEIFITQIEARGGSEFVEIYNASSVEFDIAGWTLEAAGRQIEDRFIFPAGCTLSSESALRVHSGPGSRDVAETGCNSTAGDLIWTDSFAIPNENVQIVLRDSSGNVIDQFDALSTRPIVVVETNHGVFKMQVYLDLMPITGENFLSLVDSAFYDGLIFHRAIPNFIIQGGDPLCTSGGDCGTGGSGMPIPLEISPELTHHKAGMVAMARARDPDSATSQFYITLAPIPSLDGSYAVFAEVIEGLDVVFEIGSVATGALDRPLEDVVMERVYVK